jgi:glycosyltransferase involved in cell wall biosynthesis
MRILYFSRDFNTHDHRFLSALGKSEHEVGFLQLEHRVRPLESRPIPAEIQQIQWSGGQESVSLIHGLRLVTSLKKVIQEYKPDIIQAGPVQRSALITALAGFHPLVTMSWGYDLLMDVNNGPTWKWATRFVLKRSDAMVGDCSTIRNLAIKYGMAPNRIIIFPWGANIQKYTPADVKWHSPIRKRLGWGEEKFVLLSTRSWSEIYGVSDLAKAFVHAQRKYPGMRLLMLGDGPLAPTIKQIFKQGDVEDFVHFPGQIPQEQLPEYYRSADLYISTSHSDGTSISMLEALASGTPVLLTDIPGNREWVESDGEVGWLFGDGDIESLLDGILNAFENRQDLPAMGLAARQIAESRANWEVNFPQLFKAYKVALS